SLIKRTPASKGKPPGPSIKTQQTTLKAFQTIAGQGQPWSNYFRAAHECWSRPKVRFAGRDVAAGGGAFQKAVELIDEKRAVLLAYREPDGKLPGEVQEYVAYLQQTLAATKYSTGSVPPVPAKACALCGQSPVVVYPNALKGAGINLANVDRDGAYP